MKNTTFFIILFAVTMLSAQSPGDVIISELMANPNAVSDSNGEWIELYNTTSTAIDINGWTLADLTGSHTIASSLNIPANSYVTLCRKSDPTINGGTTCNYQYSSISLNNSSDTITLSNGATVIDSVSYDGDFPSDAGKSMQLNSDFFNATSNDDSVNWCSSSATYGDGDYGTPGANNNDCETLSKTDYKALHFTVYPNPSKGNITIKAPSRTLINISIYSILGQEIINTSTNKPLTVSNLNTGIYLIKVSHKNTSITKKLVVE